jgi:hypothetical protein
LTLDNINLLEIEEENLLSRILRLKATAWVKKEYLILLWLLKQPC